MIQSFGKNNEVPEYLNVVSVKIKCPDNSFIKIEAICKPFITAPLTNQNISFAVEKYNYLKRLRLADNSEGEEKKIDILIGLDHYFAFMTGEIIKGANDREPVVMNSKLGWILSGTFHETELSRSTNLSTHMLFINTKSIHYKPQNKHLLLDENDIIKNELNQLLNSDTFSENNEQMDVFESFKNKTSFYNNRYTVELPFKDEQFTDVIPDNFMLSKNRLLHLKDKLDKDKDLLSEYDKIINDYENEGIIESVNENESRAFNTTHYLPHRPVIRNDKETTKVRIVYDASSRIGKESSLNDLLEPGPCLLPLLWCILIRFRLGAIAIVADIKQAFLQINISEKHRDVLRFI